MKPRALIPTGLGFNCEYESKKAFELAGAKADIIDIRDILSNIYDISDYDILFMIGGFSYGDDLGSGKAIANLMRFTKIKDIRFMDKIQRFIDDKKIIIGICNGFQILSKLGILPGFDKCSENQDITLQWNDSGRFENRWVTLQCNPDSPCIATKGIDTIKLPVRHGEGKIIPKDNATYDKLKNEGHIIANYIDPTTKNPTTSYPKNPNGSIDGIAGICNSTGRIIGMMPHPEAFLTFENHPHWTRLKRDYQEQGKPIPTEGDGLKIFKNIVDYISDNRNNNNP